MNDLDYMVPFLLGCVTFLVLFAAVLFLLMIANANKRRAFQSEKEELQRQITEQRQRAVDEGERTMNKVASDLHDTVNPGLSGALAHLNEALESPLSEHTFKLIREAKPFVIEAFMNIRNISHSLSAEFIKNNGLSAALNKRMETIRKMKSSLEIEGAPRSFAPDRELLIYRIAQEAISNATIHSGGTEVKVFLKYDSAGLDMKISDDGKGFDSLDLSQQKGIGISSMKDRAAMLNAKLDVVSSPAGTVIQLTCPEY